jgi:aminopeptidase N
LFEHWLYRPGHPELEVKVEQHGSVLTLSVKQAQKMDKDVPYFAFPLTIDIVSPWGRVRRETRQLDQPMETISFACAERPHFVVVDPEFALLADLRVNAPTDMLRRQLLEAPTARGRWLAAAPLGKKADPASLEALSKVLRNEKEFWGVRSQAADALATARTDAAFESLSFALKAKHPKVRRAVVRAIGQFRTPRACTALQPFALSDPSYLVEAEAARALGSTRQRAAFETLVDIIDRPSWADVIRSGALDGLAALRDERGVSHVLARTRYGVNARGRRAAIMALPKLGNDRKNREALEDLLDDRDPLVRLDVVRALGEFGDPKSRTALSKQLEREQDGRVHRRIRESLQEPLGGAKEEQQRMRDEFETLKNEHAELRAVVARLEAKLAGKPGKPAKAAKEG